MPDSHNKSICLVCPQHALGRAAIDSERGYFNLVALAARHYDEVCLLLQQEYANFDEEYIRQYGSALPPNVYIEKIPESRPLRNKDSLKAILRLPVYVMNWLSKQRFDKILFSDYGGFGYFCMLAKKSDLLFADTELSVVVGAPLLYRLRAWKEPVYSSNQLARSNIELETIANADSVAITSHAVSDWIADMGIKLDCHSQTIISPLVNDAPALPIHQAPAADEIIFYGEADVQHGIHLFCNAISRLPADLLDRCKVTILAASKPRLTISRFIDAAAENWRRAPDLRFALTRRQQLEYIAGSSGVVVAMDTSGRPGIHSYECLRMNRPVLTISSPEIYEYYDDVLVAGYVSPARPATLAKKLARLLAERPDFSTPATSFDSTEAKWGEFVGEVHVNSTASADSPQPDQPLVSICVMHHERPHLVRQAIESCIAQSYPNLEIIILDDGSENQETIDELILIESDYKCFNLKLIRQENKYLGAARNNAVRNAVGEYVYFLDDDNLLFPEAIKTLVSVAQKNGLDIVGSFSRTFTGDERPGEKDQSNADIFHMGGAVDYGLLKNGFMDSNTLINRHFFNSINGNTETYGAGKDDQEFFARALFNNAKMSIVPAPLYWARQLKFRLRHLHVNKFAGNWRVADAYLGQIEPGFRNIFLYAQGSNETLQNPLLTQTYTLALLQSRSWRATRPLRAVLEYLNHNYRFPIGRERLYEDDTNLENPPPEIAIQIQTSYSWQIFAPLRAIVGLVKLVYARTLARL